MTIGMLPRLVAVVLAAAVGFSQPAAAQSGLLKKKTKLEPITLSAGKPLAAAPYEIEAGKFYSIDIVADGSQELGIAGPEFFRNVWVNEIVINDIEVRPMAVDSLEFDDAGEATLSFIAIKPGSYRLAIPGTTSESQSVTITIE